MSLKTLLAMSFSPRNGEIILKAMNSEYTDNNGVSFSPRNGEIILKEYILGDQDFEESFSPRNGEIILKDEALYSQVFSKLVSVPAMGK